MRDKEADETLTSVVPLGGVAGMQDGQKTG
jgi:hypothetical protein